MNWELIKAKLVVVGRHFMDDWAENVLIAGSFYVIGYLVGRFL